MQLLFFTSLLAVGTNAHGVLLQVIGANGVTAPGACVLDGTPRNCIRNACGAQADTAIIRDEEIRTFKHGPLGWTQGGGDCKPDAVIGEYMGLGQAPRYAGGRDPTGKADYQVETIVGESAGKGKTDGLPTTNDNGELDLVYRQIDEDGTGPVEATVDSTSAGTDYKAFKQVQVLTQVPDGRSVSPSLTTNTNFNIKIKLSEDTVCQGEVAGLNNVCFVRIRNNAPAGPFGGAGFFTQSDGARKRAIAYRMKKRMDEGQEDVE